MNFIWFILIGLVSGWLAGVLMRGRGYGVLVDIIVGICGALLGGFLFDIIGFQARGFIASIITAVIGAVIFLAIIKAIHKNS